MGEVTGGRMGGERDLRFSVHGSWISAQRSCDFIDDKESSKVLERRSYDDCKLHKFFFVALGSRG